MSVPKSVVKIKKGGVEYTSNVDRCSYLIHELTRAALRDVGRFLRSKFREDYYKHFERHTGNGGRAAKYKVYASARTTSPRLDVGIQPGKKPGFYAYFQEVGTTKTKKLGLLRKAAERNVAEIVKIESQYLSGLENEAAALARISEKEYEDDED